MFYRRKLPHQQPEPAPGEYLFVTWRLAGSLPRHLERGRERTEPESAGRTFIMLDRQADRAMSGPLWLRDPRIAQVVANTLCYGDHGRQLYSLRAWVIMPNHVHVLLEPRVQLAKITRWVKGSTAREANQILGRTGSAFWQDESFDHRVRSDGELNRIARYIEYNPVTAGFVQDPTNWPWSSASSTGESACPTPLLYTGAKI
jgi:REP element-mobilizing transposase RayT